MKYLLLVCWDGDPDECADRAGSRQSQDEEEGFPWVDDLQARGIWLTGDRLRLRRAGGARRVRDGKTTVTDGPFAETKEAVGGFTDLLECGSLEEAVEIAASHPLAETGAIEVPTALG